MLNQPVVLVTGSSRGLGKAIALAFGDAGYAVVLHYQSNITEAEETRSLLSQKNSPVLLLQADVRQSDQVENLIANVVAEWGRIDVLVSNAGVTRDKTLEKMTNEEWSDVINTNLTGAFYCIRAVLAVMRRQEGGSIVSVGSYLAQRVTRGSGNYAAAKAGLVALTKTAAVEGGPHNIRANVVMPGFHVTDMNRQVWDRYEKNIRDQHLLKAMPEAEAMAKFVVNIAEQKTVSGQVFPFESRLS